VTAGHGFLFHEYKRRDLSQPKPRDKS
jgi:hypothetical protein